MDLKATSVANGIKLTWTRPERYAGGGSMRDLANFVVLRGEGDGPLQPLVVLPLTDRERFQHVRNLYYVDSDTRLERRYRYEVISQTSDDYESLPSIQAEITRTPVIPPSPENLNSKRSATR